MDPLFPPWSNSLLWLGLGLLGAALLGVPLLLMTWVRTPYSEGRLVPVDQPVRFDHRHHTRDDGIDCRYCHYTAETSARAGIPPTELCMGCHGQIWNDSPLLEPVRRSWTEGKPIAWRRVHRLPDFVYFDHSVHVRRGVGCATCHGEVDRMPIVYAEHPMRMAWCLDCHRDPAPHLQPETVAAIGRVSPPTNCTACHR